MFPTSQNLAHYQQTAGQTQFSFSHAPQGMGFGQTSHKFSKYHFPPKNLSIMGSGNITHVPQVVESVTCCQNTSLDNYQTKQELRINFCKGPKPPQPFSENMQVRGPQTCGFGLQALASIPGGLFGPPAIPPKMNSDLVSMVIEK